MDPSLKSRRRHSSEILHALEIWISLACRFITAPSYYHGVWLDLSPSTEPVSPKSLERFGLEKPVVKLKSACFEKLIFLM